MCAGATAFVGHMMSTFAFSVAELRAARAFGRARPSYFTGAEVPVQCQGHTHLCRPLRTMFLDGCLNTKGDFRACWRMALAAPAELPIMPALAGAAAASPQDVCTHLGGRCQLQLAQYVADLVGRRLDPAPRHVMPRLVSAAEAASLVAEFAAADHTNRSYELLLPPTHPIGKEEEEDDE